MIAFDSSVIVAAILGWHESHAAAARAVERALDSAEGAILPVHALIESYAVLTGLPAPHRLSPSDALTLLQENFGEVRLASFPSREAWSLLRGLAGQQLSGGVTYDALIVESAKEAKATTLLTFNSRDFERLDAGIEILAPRPRAL